MIQNTLLFEEDAWLQHLLKPDWKVLVDQCVRQVFAQTGWGHPSQVSCLFVKDVDIQQLNAHYRNRDTPTNVLSFPQLLFTQPTKPNPECAALLEEDPVLLGDVVFGYETVLQETMKRCQNFTDHFSHLMVHGVLHLLGYDHVDSQDAEAMELQEVAVLRAIGIPNPYLDYYE